MNTNFPPFYPDDEKELKAKVYELQKNWAEGLESQIDKDNFCFDGFYPFYTHQKEKILFIGQESYGLPRHSYIDVFYKVHRTAVLGNNKSINTSMFHRRIFYIAYGILNHFPKWSDVPYPASYCNEIFTQNGVSFAFMNVSKFSPNTSYRPTNWVDVIRSVREGAANIKKEVELLAPDIVITMSFLRDQEIRMALFDTCEAIDCTNPNVHVYRATNGGKEILVLDTWHFSAVKKEFECYYQPIANALKKHHRKT